MTTTELLATIAAIIGACFLGANIVSCTVQQNKNNNDFAKTMADKGYCRTVWNSNNWVPCSGPVQRPKAEEGK